MSDIPRVCATCVHFRFEPGKEDYGCPTCGGSGSPSVTSCAEGYWSVNGDDVTEAEVRSTMLAATYCLDYEAVEVAPRAFHPTFPHNTDGLIASLNEKYPDFIVGITNYPHHAWYERLGGGGMTTSGSFVAPGQAYLWLEERLRQMTAVEVPSAVETN